MFCLSVCQDRPGCPRDTGQLDHRIVVPQNMAAGDGAHRQRRGQRVAAEVEKAVVRADFLYAE